MSLSPGRDSFRAGAPAVGSLMMPLSEALDVLVVLLLGAALGWASTMERRVPPGAFRPPPAVMSRVCVLRPVDYPTEVDHRLVRQTVHAAFHHRRRKLRTSLRRPPRRLSRLSGWHAARWKDGLASMEDDPVLNLRPEDLSVEAWCAFCHRLASAEVEDL